MTTTQNENVPSTIEEVRLELEALRELVDVLSEFAGAAVDHARSTTAIQENLTALLKSIVTELVDVPEDGGDDPAGATLENRVEVLEGCLIALTGDAKLRAAAHADLLDSRDGVVFEKYLHRRPAGSPNRGSSGVG